LWLLFDFIQKNLFCFDLIFIIFFVDQEFMSFYIKDF